MGSDNVLFAKPKPALWTVIPVSGRGYRLVDPAGIPQQAVYANKERALTACDAAQARTDLKLKRGTRTCMNCRTPFESEGIHNRMCTRCRGLSGDGWSPYGLAPRSGRPR
jgi:hypothetical protein